MPYIGSSPPPSALTASDIADGIISEAKMADDAISLTELKAGTDGEVISWDASGNPVAIGAGSSGEFLKSQGAGSVPVFAAAAGGAFTFIDSATASNSAAIDVDSIDSTYDVYLIQYSQCRPATDGSYARIRLKVGGSAVTASDYRYGATWFSSSASYAGGTTRSDNATEIVLSYNGTSDDAAQPKSGIIWLYSPSSTSVWKNVTWHAAGMNHDGYLYSTTGAGQLESTSAVTGVSLFQNSGNLTSGNIRLYGLANS